ncbi:MAG: murein L,D-transpeptidase catalytic domain family protein [Chitinophagaceae bacterium]|nr:MAG: murein L,D-transpeptidase catalytic domain family protein [Chitinophagaceae bacterium]
MKKTIQRFSFIFTLVLLSALYLSFGNRKTFDSLNTVTLPGDSTTLVAVPLIYDSLHLELAGLNREAFDFAKKGWDKLDREGKLANDSILAIVDFSQSSTKKRLYVLDMRNYRVLFNTLVAHGRNSGQEWAESFSNSISSFKSSPGFYITGQTYNGSNGYSMKLTGLETGINDKAFERAIVMHGAGYVSEKFIGSRGYIGRSQGCPAVPVKDAKKIINTLKNGACLYIYTPQSDYLTQSQLLKDSIGV